MMSVRQFCLESQAKLLLASLCAEPERDKAQRGAITAALSEQFVDLVVMLKPDLVLEIGAHEASFSSRVANALPASRVIAFEAHPHVYDKHKARVLADKVDYRHACVSDGPGTVTLKVPLKQSNEKRTMGSLLIDTRAKGFVDYQVPGDTLDAHLGAEAQRTNVMWIDVEGAIGQVLSGAAQAIDNCQALYAEVEVEPRWKGQMVEKDVTRILTERGMTPVLRDIQRQVEGREWQHNVLYVRNSLLA